MEGVVCFPLLLYVLSDLPALIWNRSLRFVVVEALLSPTPTPTPSLVPPGPKPTADTLVTPQRNAAENSRSLSFLNVLKKESFFFFFCLVQNRFSSLINWSTNLEMIASVIYEQDRWPKTAHSVLPAPFKTSWYPDSPHLTKRRGRNFCIKSPSPFHSFVNLLTQQCSFLSVCISRAFMEMWKF